MNRERAKELLPIIRAFAEGKDIQSRLYVDKGWADISEPSFPDYLQYRIKPEPREFWLDPDDNEIWTQSAQPHAGAIKVREVLE